MLILFNLAPKVQNCIFGKSSSNFVSPLDSIHYCKCEHFITELICIYLSLEYKICQC